MKVLLDECLPKPLKRDIDAELVLTVPEAGWASKKNGELLRLAESEFDVMLTNDRNIEHQQNLTNLDLAIIVLVATTNDVNDLRQLMPQVNQALVKIKSGEIIYITNS